MYRSLMTQNGHSVLKVQINKTDRNDARGIAQEDAAELTRESRHTFLFKANHKRATASEGVEYKSSYPSYPDAVHRHFPQSKIREKNFSPHAVMSSERVGRNQLSVGASSPSE